ncbi:probable cytochrome P450 313a1 [Anopheles aquasalis]|uniref:probable cytochrome P450 313a1 n=1 Tax=Anopheles aquasalis TaxID=42839 RepID=UPI00215AD3E0|nr:probable cytochrome P450 313a1 [Anopheles aquasalis]
MIQTEVAGFIYAGHETSAITLSNTLLLLAMHPDVQEQVVAEIRQHCGALGEDIRYETLQELVYLEMVLKESLRLLPIAPFVGRQTTQEIAVGKYILPAGVDVFINVFSIHHNPTYWGEDADQFRPERFTTTTYDRSTYLPFSAGMRNCIGGQYAMISMKIMLIKIFTSYRLETDLKPNDLSMKFALTMRNADGHMWRPLRKVLQPMFNINILKSFIPIAGMRNCIGGQYAMISMKVILIKILTSYLLETDLKFNDLSMKFAVSMKNANGYMVRLMSR